MAQIRFRRISAVLAAACLVGGLANGDAVALMVTGAVAPDTTVDVTKGQLRVDLEENGLLAIIGLEDRLKVPNLREAKYQPLACAYEATQGTRACRSRSGGDTINSAVTFTLRDTAGRAQESFDHASTDTVLIQSAHTRRGVDKAGHPTSSNGRGTKAFANVSDVSHARTLNGADTLFRTKRFGTRLETTEERVIVYSGVTLANGRAERFPSAGVVYVTRHRTSGERTAPMHAFDNLIVHFDGTRNPEVYISGKHYRLDLVTQIATPISDD